MLAVLLASVSVLSLLHTTSAIDYSTDLSTLSGTDGFRMIEGAGDSLGNSVAMIGDFDGDGFDDFIVSAPTKAVGAKTQAGVAYIVLGNHDTASWQEMDMTTFVSNSKGMKIIGANTDDETGVSLSAAGKTLQIAFFFIAAVLDCNMNFNIR